jgi:hypothetical protein
MKIPAPGRAPTRLEILLITPLLPPYRYENPRAMQDKVIIHHITENSTGKLQVEIERRIRQFISSEKAPYFKTVVLFERVIL